MNRIGRYEVVEQIGEGGFGRVFKAWDPAVNRHVAIKIVTAEADRDMLERFKHEAGTTANLMHKNIVTVYEFGEHNGMPFLAMELLQGRTLQAVIQEINEGRFSLSLHEKVRILTAVAEGLHFAHTRSVIHRDIKPLNVMYLPDGNVKILDFGIARALGSGMATLTRKGDMIGSIMYMAPEQFRNTDADVSTDIFSYGVLAYELLSGQHPFPGKDAGTIMYQINAADPAPIPNVPERLDAIVHRALAKDREIRYRSLEDIQFDLQPLVQELRRERAASLLNELRPVIEGADAEAALRALGQVLELDAVNTEARRLRDELQKKAQQQAVRLKVEALVQEGEVHLSRREYNEAISSFEAVIRLDRTVGSVLARIDEARARQDAHRRAARLVAEARVQFEGGDVAGGLSTVGSALELEPDNPDACALRERIQAEIRRRELEQQLNDGLELARQHAAAKDFDGALGVLHSIEKEQPAAVAAIGEARNKILAAKSEEERRIRHEQFLGKLAQAQMIEDAGDIDAAHRSLETLAAEYREERAAHEALHRVRGKVADRDRDRSVRETIEKSRALRQMGHLEQALATVDALLQRYPGQLPLITEQREVRAAMEERQRRQRIEEIVRNADALVAREQVDAALELLEDASLMFPGEASLDQPLARAREAKFELQRRDFVRGALGRIAALEQARRWNDAMAETEGALRDYPGNPELTAAGERIARLVDEENRRLADHAAAIERAADAKNWIAAIVAAQTACSEFPARDEFLDYNVRAWREQRRTEIQQVSQFVQACIREEQFDLAVTHLDSMKPVFGRETVWGILAREVDQRREIRDGIRIADEHLTQGRFNEAEELLARLAANDTSGGQVLARLNQVRAERAKWQQAQG